MGITYNGVDVTSVVYNGSDVNELRYNGTTVFSGSDTIATSTDTVGFGGDPTAATDPERIFESNTTTGAGFVAIQKDYGEVTEIRSFTLTDVFWVDNSIQPAELSFQTSDDGTTWTTQYAMPLGGSSPSSNFNDIPISVNARYVAIRMTQFGANGYLSLNLFSVSAYEIPAAGGGTNVITPLSLYEPNAYEGIDISDSGTYIAFAGDGSLPSGNSFIAVHAINSDGTIGPRVGDAIDSGQPYDADHGWSIAVTDAGDKVIAGSKYNPYVKIWAFESGAWVQKKELITNYGITLTNYFHQVSIDAEGRWALCSAPYYNTNAGYVWHISLTSYNHYGMLTTWSEAYDYFGNKLKIQGEYAMLVSQGYGTNAARTGRYAIVRKDFAVADSAWNQVLERTSLVSYNQLGAYGIDFVIDDNGIGHVVGMGIKRLEYHRFVPTVDGSDTTDVRFNYTIDTVQNSSSRTWSDSMLPGVRDGSMPWYGVPRIRGNHVYIFIYNAGGHSGYQKYELTENGLVFVEAEINENVITDSIFDADDKGRIYYADNNGNISIYGGTVGGTGSVTPTNNVGLSIPAGDHYRFNTTFFSEAQIADINSGTTANAAMPDTGEYIRFTPGTLGLEKELTIEADGSVYFPGYETPSSDTSPAINTINLASNLSIGENTYKNEFAQVPKSGSIWFKPSLGIVDGVDHGSRSQYLVNDAVRANGNGASINQGWYASLGSHNDFLADETGEYGWIAVYCLKVSGSSFSSTNGETGSGYGIPARIRKNQLPADFKIDEWHNLIFSINPTDERGSIEIWLDGIYTTKTSITTAITDGNRLRPYWAENTLSTKFGNNDVFSIGGRQHYNYRGFNFHGHFGQMDVFTNKQLTTADAQTIYNTTKSGYGY